MPFWGDFVYVLGMKKYKFGSVHSGLGLTETAVTRKSLFTMK